MRRERNEDARMVIWSRDVSAEVGIPKSTINASEMRKARI